MQDLLSFVQNRGRVKREDLASDVLALLLREEPGQSFLRELLSKRDALTGAPIEVITRRSVAGCVPDIILGQETNIFAVLEMKFWAPLTAHQISGRYFDVAPLVIFVLPAERVSALEIELAGLQSRYEVVLMSWKALLGHLEQACEHENSPTHRLFAGALAHLKEFCDVTEKEHFTPFTTEQLHTPIHEAGTDHLVWLTREVLSAAIKAEMISEAGRLGAGFDESFFYGQNVILNGMRLWLGYWPKVWRQWPSAGPLWLQIYGREASALLETGAFADAHRLGGKELAFPILKAAMSPTDTQEDEVLLVLSNLRAFSERFSLQFPLAPQTQLG